MTGVLLNHGGAVLVCDGRKALFLVNEGRPGGESLRVAREIEQDLASHTSDLGSDRPGLVRQTSAGSPGSAIEGADWHAQEETKFLTRAVAEFAAFVEERPSDQVVLVAPPRALAVLRDRAPAALLDRTVLQVDKDLTKHPVPEIARLLFG